MTHREKAVDLFMKGYNCSQAVFGAFSEELGMDFELAVKLSSAFGGGIGRQREVCGAVSGMYMALDLKQGYSEPKNVKIKMEHYAVVQELARRFKENNGNSSIVCRELLGIPKEKVPESPMPEERTVDYFLKRPCIKIIGDAAETLEQYFLEQNKNED